jgi:hypothetical protein
MVQAGRSCDATASTRRSAGVPSSSTPSSTTTWSSPWSSPWVALDSGSPVICRADQVPFFPGQVGGFNGCYQVVSEKNPVQLSTSEASGCVYLVEGDRT